MSASPHGSSGPPAGAGSGVPAAWPPVDAARAGAGPGHTQPAMPKPKGPLGGVLAMLRKYGRMLWWFHSFYALGLGIFVVLFAAKGFAHARFLTISLAAAWLVLIVFFRVFGSGTSQHVEGKGAKLRFFVMTYVLKNMYQGMLFFLLPFYWRSVTMHSPNQWFLVGLVLCAALSTLDVVFDRMLMRWKMAASVFYFFTLFACLNLVVPALLPNIRAALTLTIAAAVSALAFWTMHIPVKTLGRPAGATLLVGWTVASLAGAWYGRAAVPPVAMYLRGGAVGPTLLPDGRLALEVHALHRSLVHELYAVTDVFTPGGKGDRLVHEWRKDGVLVQRSDDVDPHPEGLWDTVRLRSRLDPSVLATAAGAEVASAADDGDAAAVTGAWTVDTLTEDGQLVGRVAFAVIE
ncbi:MAG: hypothetical protein IPH07_25805 [Deltaproteobacteria bacterium]|nr:hypothetical protein [Deltaproteobacteria bacterium]MBP7291962.1 hypothetical protein [Nannocystaceae bacterium]